jgi:High potential iron-sulfur protein
MTGPQEISKRRMLTIAAGAAGTSIGAAMIVGTPTPAAAAKVSQQVVKYQPTPKGDQHCENCQHFEPPSSCQSVDGTVSPQGWCMIYAKKPT